MKNLRKTPLFARQESLGGKMVEFAGWLLPVEYRKGLRQEHLIVRSKVGLFDVSHMGEIRIRGPRSLEVLERLTTNWVSHLSEGQAQYTLLTNEVGGVVDDLIIYCLKKGEDYLACVNASNTEKDFLWFCEKGSEAEIINESEEWAQLALQGPHSDPLVQQIFGNRWTELRPFEFLEDIYCAKKIFVARTGYTGERGFEIFVPPDLVVRLWDELLHGGEKWGVGPIGLGARDTLRTEMKYPLYGHELDDHTNPYEAGLGWVVKPDKKDFIGKEVIMGAKEQGLSHKLVGFQMVERGIARPHYRLFSFDNKEMGKVTSGTISPTLDTNIGIGYVRKEWAQPGTQIKVEIRGKMVNALVVKTPFVRIEEDRI